MAVRLISEHECLEYPKHGRCGERWFQATVEGHVVGACGLFKFDDQGVPFIQPFSKKDLPLSVNNQVDKETGQVTVTLVTAAGEPVTAVAFTPQSP